MKKRFRLDFCLACLALPLLVVSCSDDNASGNAHAKTIKTVNDIGLYPNAIAQDDSHVYVVDSGNNTIDRLDKKTHQYTDAFIDLGQDAGPYAIHLDGEDIYVVNNMAANVIKTTKSAPTKHEIIASKEDGLIAPTSVTTGKGNVVIADSEFNYTSPKDTEGKWLVIDKNGQKHSLKTPHPNPTQVLYLDNDGEENALFFTITSGITLIDKKGSATPPQQSCVEVIDAKAILEPKPLIKSTCVDNASLGTSAFSGELLYCGSGSTPEIGRLKIISNELLAKLEFEPQDNASMLIPAVIDARYFVVADFNRDIVTLIDGQQANVKKMRETEIQLLDKPATRKGPISMVYDESTKLLYVLNNISNSIDIVEITLPEAKK